MRLVKVNPRKPIESGFGLHIAILKYCGLWPFMEDEKKLLLYNLFGATLILLFLVIFVVTQIAYIVLYTDSIKTFADAFYFLLIQGAALPKNLLLRKEIHRIKTCLDKLETELFLAKDAREDEYVGSAIKINLFIHRFGIFMCFLCIFSWTLTVITGEKPTIVYAVFPFEYKTGPGFYFVFVFQLLGTLYSAVTFVTADSLFTGLLLQSTAQIHRLCGRLEHLGHPQSAFLASRVIEVMPVEGEANKKKELYDELVSCIKHHKEVLNLCQEMQKSFSNTIFIHLCVSLFSLCMTELLLILFMDDRVFFFNVLPCFSTVSFQIWLVNFAGNEVHYASKNLMSHAYFSNFVKMDDKARKLLITFMEKLKFDIVINVGISFKVPLLTTTFLSIMKTSYSYFAVLRTIQAQ